MGWFWGREMPGGGYEPSILHRWLRPRISGNEINGHGESEARRPRYIYHRFDRSHPWRTIQLYFMLHVIWGEEGRRAKRVFELNKRKPDPIAPRAEELTPQEWTARIKTEALRRGYEQVGICELTADLLFEGEELSHRYAIILAKRMDFDRFSKCTERDFVTSDIEVLDTYYFGNLNAKELANWLRGQGHSSLGFGSMDASALNLVPAAIRAGIGELGKHGSLISKELGSAFRLSYVFTDAPLIPDEPVDIGANDFCLQCKLCTTECPPGAIHEEPQLVRGERKWYVDFDKCVPYFNENHSCGLCLAVCPWSKPGVSQRLSEKMLVRRNRET